jgi:predicted nucleotidyltransferase
MTTRAVIKTIWTRVKAVLRREFEKLLKKLKPPENPDEVIPGLIGDYTRVFGEDLISICLYGSGARGDYIPGRSDLNFLIILTEEGMTKLDKAFRVVARWRRRHVATPLCMTTEYLTTSLDTFPLEFLNIKRHYRVVWGEDPLTGVTIGKNKLRLQLEREIKGKLLQLRAAYLASRGWKWNLVTLATQSLTSFVSIFQGVLYLRGKEIPHKRDESIEAIAGETGLAPEPFARLLAVKEGRLRLPARELKQLVMNYMEEVRRLASWIDKM